MTYVTVVTLSAPSESTEEERCPPSVDEGGGRGWNAPGSGLLALRACS